MKTLIPVLLALAVLAGVAGAEPTLLLRQPDVSSDHVVFVYAGDLWLCGHDGQAPYRLTSSAAAESEPVFSPDGSMVAYAASHENNTDVYIIGVDGGQPRRLTWHPRADTPTGWTADGHAVTMVSSRETGHGRSAQLYHVDLAGGLPRRQMEARIFRGAYDADDSHLAYMAYGPAYNGLYGGSSGWKGYRGGTAPEIHVMDLKAGTDLTIAGHGASCIDPTWVDGQVYFASDRENEIFNIYRYDPATAAVTRITGEPVWDVRAMGGHGSTMVYEAGGRLKRMDLTSGAVSEIVVDINPDLPQLRPSWKSARRAMENANLSPTGQRALITARGDIFTVPVDEGSTRNITTTGARRESAALWSPDGSQIAYITDSLEGQNLVIVDQNGQGPVTTHELGRYFYDLLGWTAGDDARIIVQDNHLHLFSIDVDKGKVRDIATGARRENFDIALSADGRWLAYTQEQPNFHRDLVLFDLDKGDRHLITDGMADVASPAFSPDGRHLFFAASTNTGPTQVGLNMNSQERPYRAGLYAAVLSAEGASPLLPGHGDENEDEDETDKDDDDEKKDDDEDSAADVDPEGLSSRIVALPVAEANYRNLAVAHDGNLLYVRAVQPGGSIERPGETAATGNTLMRFDMEEREASSLMSGVRGFSLSSDGKSLLISRVDGPMAVAEVGAKLDAEPLDLSGLKVHIDPRQEWSLIFDEVWRMEREYFYDPAMHSLDWDAVYDRYRPLLDHVGRREDLNTLLVEMIAEMQAGHNRVGGGDVHREESVECGLLGADLELVDGHYRLARVFTGETWNPFLVAPLATPGNEAHAGEYILAVNGQPLAADQNIFALLQGTVGEQVTLRVGPEADGDKARDIIVEPVGSEYALRLWHWVEANRRRVDEATDGRVGYIYLPNTAGAGYTFFNRMFYPQLHKDALIIDERSNGGGQAADYIVSVLSRAHLSGWKDRDGLTYNTPAGAMYGPKLMLIDQDAGSGGDYLPYAFRELGIGKLMGTRTWGGLIGIATNPGLVDGGFLTVPFFRFYDADHTWTVENEGVAPDLEVTLDPEAANQGVDSQLEAAIAEVQSQLEGFVNPVPTGAPAYPTELGK